MQSQRLFYKEGSGIKINSEDFYTIKQEPCQQKLIQSFRKKTKLVICFIIMITFTATILKFSKQGEKTGWSYIEIPAGIPEQLKPGNKKEFKVKGKLDQHPIKRMPLLPMGGGKFILVLNADIRKAIGKTKGAVVEVKLTVDNSDFIFNADFMDCLSDEPSAKQFFNSLTGSHQRYFSKWIDSAKTDLTKTKRIALAVNALSKKMGYPEMIRAEQTKKDALL